MPDTDKTRAYLVTPPELDPGSFPELLAATLDACDVACVRLSLSTRDEDRIARAADSCLRACHDRDVPLVVDSHLLIAERHGLDGVHLPDGARQVRAARKSLGSEAIVGAFCGATRHGGLSAAEAGADYVSFGPAGGGALGDGTRAQRELFAWWSEMIEVPVVAEGPFDAELARSLAPAADFLAFGEEVWSSGDPAAALGELVRAMQSGAPG